MLAEILPKIAGFEREDNHPYYRRPSIAGPERCIRQMVYWASNTPQDKQMSDRMFLILDDSSWHAYLVVDWLNKSAYHVHSQEMEIQVTSVGTGHIDGIVTDMLNRDRLLENKALNHFTFEKYWNGAWPYDYLTQCCEYIEGLQKLNPNIDEAVLLIKNKNTSQFIDMLIKYDTKTDIMQVLEVSRSTGEKRVGENGAPLLVIENIVSDAIKKFDAIDKHVADRTLPERQFEMGDWHCSYCSWGDTCWAGYEQEYEKLIDNAELEGDIVDLCRLYLEESMHETNARKVKEELKKQIKDIMKAANASKGRAGDYLIHNRLQHEERVMGKDEIPEHIRPLVVKQCIKEVLTIRKPKPEGKGKK